MLASAIAGGAVPLPNGRLAASTMEHGTELVTLERDFGHVAQILVATFEP